MGNNTGIGEERAKGQGSVPAQSGRQFGGRRDHCYKLNTYVRHERSCVMLGTGRTEV